MNGKGGPMRRASPRNHFAICNGFRLRAPFYPSRCSEARPLRGRLTRAQQQFERLGRASAYSFIGPQMIPNQSPTSLRFASSSKPVGQSGRPCAVSPTK